jgi:hypothetical protein
VLGVVLLVPSIAVHRRHANHRDDGLVDAFARTVFASLPQNAVLFSWGAERSFPLQYRQTVFGDRRDVALINADQITLPWYREEASRRLGLRLPRTPGSADDATEAALIAARLRPRRPVYLEGAAMPSMIKAIGYKPSGIVAEVVDGPGVKPPDSLTDLEHLVTTQQQRAGIVGGREQRRFPNEIVVQSFVVAELEVATAFYNAHDYVGAERHLLAALRLDPDNRRIPGQLDQVRNQPRTR